MGPTVFENDLFRSAPEAVQICKLELFFYENNRRLPLLGLKKITKLYLVM